MNRTLENLEVRVGPGGAGAGIRIHVGGQLDLATTGVPAARRWTVRWRQDSAMSRSSCRR